MKRSATPSILGVDVQPKYSEKIERRGSISLCGNMEHIETVVIELLYIGRILNQCVNRIQISLERCVVKWRPPLIESLSVNPFFNLNFVDLLLAPSEINEKLSLPINPFKHCMMQQIKSFRVNEIRDWYHHCLKNISYQQIILIAKLIKCKVPIKVILADILSSG